MALTPPHATILAGADRRFIESEFALLRSYWARGSWLQRGNRFRSDPIDCIKNRLTARSTPPQSHLCSYIAASSILHCLDGWGFFGRAIDAELSGDCDVARHMGYYAELRAGMALLASEGIGVFDNCHGIVTANQSCRYLSASRTHRFTWDALETWAQSPAAVDILFKIIRPGGVPLEDWLNQFSLAAGFRSILASRWLEIWGLDLQRFSQDRDARNFVSYRPTAFTPCGIPNINDTCNAIRRIWELCEPTGSIHFRVLDRFLLRESLYLTFRSAHTSRRTPRQSMGMYTRQVQQMLNGVTPLEMSTSMWESFLTFASEPDEHEVLKDAKGRARLTDVRHSKQVLARALMLLRLAMGACRNLLQTLPNISRSELEFWWLPLGEKRGLWQNGATPADFIDLWTDVRDALTDIDQWLQGTAAVDISCNSLWNERSSQVGILGSTERIGLWGLGL